MPFDQLFGGTATPAPATDGTQTSTPATTGTPTTTAAPATPAAPTAAAASNIPINFANLGAGLSQGAVRDPISTFIPAGRWLEQNVPGVRALDVATGITPEAIEAQNQAYLQGAGKTLWGLGGRLGGNVLASSAIPIPGAAAAPGIAGSAVRGALAGGLGSAFTSGGYGQNPLTAGIQGAVGGGAIGAATGALVQPVNSFLSNTADRLGIDLSQGQLRGGFLNRLEDLSAPFFGSGSGTLAKNQNSQIVNVLQRNMGAAETGSLDLPAINTARRAAGSDMQSVAGTMSIDGTAPSTSGVAGTPPLSLTDRLDEIYNQAASLGTDTPQARAADALRNQINAGLTTGGGSMSGSDFQKFIANGNTLDRFADNSNSEVQGVAAEVRNALFAAANNTPSNPAGALDAFQQAQLRYKAALTAADAIGRTGSSDAMTPLGLKQAIERHYMDQMMNPAATGTGYDMPDLARMIRNIPKFASSGTAERQTLYNAILGGGGAALGAFAAPAALTGALYGAAPLAALSAAGRLSRFGPTLGVQVPYAAPVMNALGGYVNPLLPRLAGQGLGNLLTTGTMPQPGGTR